MANDLTYANQLRKYVTEPGSYEASPGFKFARDAGLDAVSRSSAARGLNGSGNMLAELTKYATGLAGQDYGATLDRLDRFAGREGTQALGETQAENTLALGHEANANTRTGNDQQFGLGLTRAANDYSLGNRNADNTATGNWYNYQLGGQRNANDAAANQNTFNTNTGRNAIDWYGAQTQRGAAQSTAYNNDQRNQLDWYKATPRNRIAGGP